MARAEPAQRNGGTREVILRTAERLFAERGFAATSVRDIVGEAGTSAPSLYHFFGSKENLVVELINDRHTAYCDALESNLTVARTPFDVSQRFVKFVLTNMTKRPTSAKFVLGIMFGPQQDVPKEAVGETLMRSQQILQVRLREVSDGVSESRIVFARMMLLGMVTPAVLLFLTSGVQSFSPKLPGCIAHRIVDMLTDAHPTCAWPSVESFS
ncbi:MAG: TetR/AcrR family transcriptional regulator [Deltaproteobacteria bacterium]|nr:TetR/AcrR family transcriptional regulator [Deltaproteobacteria bacterium]MBW2212757.1 TetR/AcrR family transcriptional regulator [Deltaproteobacteria bacterium]